MMCYSQYICVQMIQNYKYYRYWSLHTFCTNLTTSHHNYVTFIFCTTMCSYESTRVQSITVQLLQNAQINAVL